MSTKQNRKGVVLVWTAASALVLVGMMGMACDYAYCLLQGAQLQAVADAASLAGALYVQTDSNLAQSEAQTIAARNTVAQASLTLKLNPSNSATGDIVVGVFNLANNTFTPTLTAPNAVQVNARRTTTSSSGPLGLLFGPLFGIATANVQRTAIAITGVSGVSVDGIVVLDPKASSALSLTGNASILVNAGGDVQVDSSSPTALTETGNANLNAANVNVVGGDNFTGNSGVTGKLATGATSVSDPLASLPAPAEGTNLGTVNLSGNSSKTLNPGYYPGGISTSGNASLTLNPGVYVVNGAGLNITGNGSFTAQGVTFYVTGTGTVNLSGNGALNMTPPTSGTYEGVSIFQDRADTNSASITGNGSMNLDGAVYMPSAPLTIHGNGGTVGSQLVVDKLTLTGNGSITVNHAAGTLPPEGGAVYLVQ